MLLWFSQLKEMAEKQSQKDSISTNSKHTDKEKSETVTQASNQTHIRSMVSQDSQNENNLTSKSFANGHRKQNDKPEKVVQDEPGVYLTLLSLPGGGTELKRVRFRYMICFLSPQHDISCYISLKLAKTLFFWLQPETIYRRTSGEVVG